MMKNVFAVIFFSVFLTCETAPKNGFIIEVNAPDVYNGIHTYLKGVNEKGRLFVKDTAIVFNETFTIKGERNEPSLEYLFIDGCEGYLPIIVENAKIKVTINKDNLITSKINGTKNNEAYQNYYFKEKTLADTHEKLISEFKQATLDNSPDKQSIYKKLKTVEYQLNNLSLDYIKVNENTFLSLILLYDNFLNNQMESSEVEVIFEKFPENLKTSHYGKRIAAKLESQRHQ